MLEVRVVKLGGVPFRTPPTAGGRLSKVVSPGSGFSDSSRSGTSSDVSVLLESAPQLSPMELSISEN